MSRSVLLMVSLGILAGCANDLRVDQPDRTPRQIDIGWIRGEWRLCDGEACPQPTRKTLDLVMLDGGQQKPFVQADNGETAQQAGSLPASIVVHFDLGKSTPNKRGMEALQDALMLLRKYGEYGVIRIEGYTDELGGIEVNQRLASRRAEFVAVWLKRHGVMNPMRIKAQGKCCYVAPNDSDMGRAANRRVEIHFSTTRKENDR